LRLQPKNIKLETLKNPAQVIDLGFLMGHIHAVTLRLFSYFSFFYLGEISSRLEKCVSIWGRGLEPEIVKN
jgi:hypothetical protein